MDASALVVAVTDTTERGAAVRRRLLGEAEAVRSLGPAEQLVVDRYPHPPLRALAWSQRQQVSYDDALYVALAIALGVVLVTADRRLSGAARCAVELV